MDLNLDMVIHPTTNPDRRLATTLMETNALSLTEPNQNSRYVASRERGQM